MSATPKKSNILVLTFSYPSYCGDFAGHFIKNIYSEVGKYHNVFVLAPGKKQMRTVRSANHTVYWYRPSVFGLLPFSIKGPIINKLIKNPLFFFLVPFLLFNELMSMRKVCKREKIDEIHAHWILPHALLAVIYKKMFRKTFRIIGMSHGSDINRFESFLGKRMLKFALRGIDIQVAVSNDLKSKIKRLGFQKDIWVIPTGTNTTYFSPGTVKINIREKFKIKKNMILYVGNLLKLKGVSELLRAMPMVLKEFPDTSLLFVGDGEMRFELARMTQRMGIQENVRFSGVVVQSELRDYYRTSDLFVFPSYSEGFSNVLREAMSSEIPVIVSPDESNLEIVNHSEYGIVTHGFSENDYAEKIIYALRNRDALKPMTIKARRHVVEHFDQQIINSKYLQLANTI